MSDLEKLAIRSERLFRELSTKSMNSTSALEGGGKDKFDQFDPKQIAIAGTMSAGFAALAESANNSADGIAAVLERAEEEAVRHPALLVQHALALFATHSPIGRLLRKPRMMQIMPEAALPGRRQSPLEGATGEEGELDYWRENAFANEHHQHWHEVYPGIGVIRPIAEIPEEVIVKIQTQGWDSLTSDELRQVFRPQDRHGELFVYMHQQMLARYDAERLSNGLASVEPLDANYLNGPVGAGFEPGPTLATNFGSRLPGITVPVEAADALSGWISAIREAIVAGAFQQTGDQPPIEITPALLGDQIEAVHPIYRGAVDQNLYGNLHNQGHGMLADLSEGQPGVMASTVTAIRDPVFFRWHRLIDDLSFSWQETRDPVPFDDSPSASFSGTDWAWASRGILLLDSKSLPDDVTEAEALVQSALGGDAWDTNISAGQLATSNGNSIRVLDTLTTVMKRTMFPVPNTPGGEMPVDYLTHEPFSYALRLQSLSAGDQTVTVRIFMCPERLANSRRNWIEMDKFSVNLSARTKTVVLRNDVNASIVKKPAEPELHPDLLADAEGDPRCDCGWPYSLLLPRGTVEGMNYRMLAVLTDGAYDSVAQAGNCGSLSFCGVRDEVYPDRRDMGYPFDRPWTGTIADTVTSNDSMAGKAFVVRHQPLLLA